MDTVDLWPQADLYCIEDPGPNVLLQCKITSIASFLLKPTWRFIM